MACIAVMIVDTVVSPGTTDTDPGKTTETAEFEDVAAAVLDTEGQGEALEEPG
jgi:hypothetical protein